jgi:hypothetical protein
VVLEGGQNELTHVALIEGAGAGRKPVLQVQVCEPHVAEVSEGSGRGELALTDVLLTPLGEHLLELPLGGLRGVRCRLDAAQLAVVVPEPGQRGCSAVVGLLDVDLAEGALRRLRASRAWSRRS